MLDLIAAIYELPIACFYDAAKEGALEATDYMRFNELYHEFLQDIKELSEEQLASHAELLQMLYYVKRCYDMLMHAD